MGERTVATLRLAAWGAALIAVGRLLVAAGDGQLTVPLTSLAAVDAWADRTPPHEMAVAVLRLAGIAACAYLLVVTAVGAIARSLRLHPLVDAVDRVSPRLVRRLAAGGSGAGLVLGAVVGALPVPDVALRAPGTTVAAAPDDPAPSPARATMTRIDPPAEAATMYRIEPPPATPAGPVPTASAAPAPTETSLPPLPAVDPGAWVVEPGDSLWSIAAEVVHADRRGSGTVAVSLYWRALVAANRSRLVDPDNPDLLIPGQHLVLPPRAG